jgi:glycyl-tRNA synthetase beta chain
MAEQGYAKDVIAAVVDVTADNIPDVWRRVSALESLKHQADFEPLVAGFKRVGNIIKKSEAFEADAEPGVVKESLFEHKSESTLHGVYQAAEKKVTDAMARGQFDQALKEIASLRNPVDAFFEDVMVLTEDPAVRSNRLNLLGHIARLFGKFADFSKISV